MGDLIDRKALLELIVNTPTEESGYNPVYLNGCATRQFEILDIIERMPIVDAVPVVRGEWKRANNRPKSYIRICSICNRESYTCFGEKEYDFCPWCGADMRSSCEPDAKCEKEMTFGMALKEKLEEKDMSQRELAEKTGMTEVSISRYVSDVRSPNLKALMKIADALGCTIDELVRGKKV